MLKFEQQPEPLSAADARVTAEELASALAAIEAKKEKETHSDGNTIAVGEALRELGSEAAPEEVLAEILAQRARPPKLGPRQAMRRIVEISALFLLVGSAAAFGLNHILTEGNPPADATPPAQTSVYVPPARPQTIVATLAEVPDGGSFYCDDTTANKIMEQEVGPSSNVLVTEGTPQSSILPDEPWTFSKKGNTIYVHGYTSARSPEAIQLGNIPVYRIAIDDSGVGGDESGQPSILVSNIPASKSE